MYSLIGCLSLIVFASSIIDFIVNNLVFVIGIPIAVGVIILVLYDYLNKPKPVFEVSNIKEGKLGFSVYVRKKEVEKATVRCNGIKYQWETADGVLCDEVDLKIGDLPVAFYPFKVSTDFIQNLDLLKKYWANDSPQNIEFLGGVLLSVTEPASGKSIYQVAYAVPSHSRYLLVLSPWDIEDVFKVRIKIVGIGIREEKDYILRVGLQNLLIHPIKEGKPMMEYLEFGFEVKETSKFSYRRKANVMGV